MSSRFVTDLKNIFKKTKLFGSLFCCTLTLASCSTEFKTSTDYLIAGKEYFKAGDYKKAEVEFQKALKKEPDSATVKATATNNLGVIYNEEGRFDDAIAVLKEATTVDPKNAIARYVLANALTKKGRFDEALIEAQMSTELDKSEPGAYRSLAEAALGKGDVALAITSYRIATHLEPDNENTHMQLGLALGEVQDWDGQITEERKALDINPDNIEARLALAVALHKKGQVDESLQEVKTVLAKDSDNADAKRIMEAFGQQSRSVPSPRMRLDGTQLGQNKPKM